MSTALASPAGSGTSGQLDTSLQSTTAWAEREAQLRWEARGKPEGDDWSDWFAVTRQLEDQFALAHSENHDWIRQNAARLIRENPDWEGRWIAVACRSANTVLAVADDWDSALQQGLQSTHLGDLARQQNLPAPILLTVASLDDP
jgi:hypothetical protein